ncbi:hypothetical protein GOBAR_AA13881 [Gossypium barbadense]|uniref:Major facilitator superfamily (MFS) profile domain-containing protein n=1 Tax=Gossypium barbadense TaxID=3634 RepID=A0A2P5XTV5_GOSBA|nr:hypothetical protein GOBAR_AA13881 [Gossypium barbadense]
MEQQRKEATERLLSRQGHHNLVYNEENDGVGVEDEGLVAVSNFTSILGLSTLTAACITFGFGCAIGYSWPTQSSIMEDLGLSVAEAPWLLNLGRLSLGFTNGISNYLASIYVAEITTKNVRGRFTIIVQVINQTLPVMHLLAHGSYTTCSAVFNWLGRVVHVCCWFLCPLAHIGSVSHDSRSASTPTSLLHTRISSMAATENISVQAKFGREKELEAALLCLRGDKADISHEATEIKDSVESLKSFSSEGILDIFQKKYVRQLLTVAGVLVLMNLGGINALTYYSGAIFVSAGVSSMVGLITLAATQTVIGILGATLIDKLGRRPLLLVSQG